MSCRGTFLQLGVQKGPRNPRSGQGRERSLCQLLSVALRKQQAAALTVVMIRVIGTGNTRRGRCVRHCSERFTLIASGILPATPGSLYCSSPFVQLRNLKAWRGEATCL